MPRSAPVETTAALRSPRFSSTGSGILPGNRPSALELSVTTLHPICCSTMGVMVSAGPLAQSTTTFSSAVSLSLMIRSTCFSTASGKQWSVPTRFHGLSAYSFVSIARSMPRDWSTP